VGVARFHNIFGPEGTWQGGREKAPAALCRKVAEQTDGGEIEIWGDGEQTRSFLYIDECVEAVRLLMKSAFPGPLPSILHAFLGTTSPSVSLPAPLVFSRPALYSRFCLTSIQVGSLLFHVLLPKRATARYPGEVQQSFRSRLLSFAFAVT
jgi:NAD dependent epimerase/dehydratase family